MNLKILGAILVIVGCGSVGFRIAAGKLCEERYLRECLSVLDFMECDLQYRMTPLPELCRCTATHCKGNLKQFFLNLIVELEDQISPDVSCCTSAALSKTKGIPSLTRSVLSFMGKTLGRFDLEGQMKSLEGAKVECQHYLSHLEKNRNIRLRNYQTLGLCAGAALAILFI